MAVRDNAERIETQSEAIQELQEEVEQLRKLVWGLVFALALTILLGIISAVLFAWQGASVPI